jgi:lipoprotein NlpD
MVFRCKILARIFPGSLVVLFTLLLTACGTHTYHQVRRNDTLYSISWHYKQDYRKVAEWNNLSPPYTIHEGQWLRVVPPMPEDWASEVRESGGNAQTHARTATVPAGKISANSASVSAATTSAAPLTWQWPVRGEIIRKFVAGRAGQEGIDIAGTAGTPVNAAAAGRVVYSGNGLRGYGNLIIIKHNEKFLSAYAHNQSLYVKEGDKVKQGQQIARMGKTESSRVLLHFQIRIDGKPVDPLRYLPK